MRVLAYLLEGEEKEVLLEQMEEAKGEYESGRTVMGTLPDVCNSLLQQLLQKEVLRTSYE